MTTLAGDREVTISKNRWQKAGRIGGLVLVLAITIGILIWGGDISNLPIYGYPAIFVLSLLANATVLIPAPAYLVVFAAGTTLDPFAVGIIAGLGGAIGELTGYLAGASGKGTIENRPSYHRIKAAMTKSGSTVIFLLGLVPNFVFDIGGMLAGATGMPIWRFLLMAWAGKSIRLVIVALTGSLWA